MKVNEIEINGKVYRATYIKDANKYYICDHCDLKSYCVNDKENAIVFDLCQRNPFDGYFKEVKQKENITNKFYKFSSGTVFNVNQIKDILFISFVEKYNSEYYSFKIILKHGTVELRFKKTIIATRERNKFIKFIERYGNTDNSI